jgi:rhodanese-related sulfurtransferase
MAVREVSIDELESAIARGATLIDVREAHEFAAGHVPAAQLVPMGTVPDNLHAFRGGPADEAAVYVICQSGGRSLRVCEFLAEQGIDAANVRGGTGAWVMSGREVELGATAS